MDTKGIPSDNPYGKPMLGLVQVEFRPMLGPFYAWLVEVEGVNFSGLLCCRAHLLLILQGNAFDPEKYRNPKTQKQNDLKFTKCDYVYNLWKFRELQFNNGSNT